MAVQVKRTSTIKGYTSSAVKDDREYVTRAELGETQAQLDDVKSTTIVVRGSIDASNSLTVDAGDYSFAVMKNTNNKYASFYIKRNDGVSTPCIVCWKSAWGTTSQWDDNDVTVTGSWTITDNDLGYGNGGSHVVEFMDKVSLKYYRVSAMVDGNADDQADFGCMIVETKGAQ